MRLDVTKAEFVGLITDYAVESEDFGGYSAEGGRYYDLAQQAKKDAKETRRKLLAIIDKLDTANVFKQA